MLGGICRNVVEATRISTVLHYVAKVYVARIGILWPAPACIVEVADQDLEIAGDESIHVGGDVHAGRSRVGT